MTKPDNEADGQIELVKDEGIMTGKEMAKALGLDDPVFSKGSHTLFDDEDYDILKLMPKVKIPKFVADYIDYCKRDIPHSPSRIGVGSAMQPEYMCVCLHVLG